MTPAQHSRAEREAIGIRTYAGGRVKLYAVVRGVNIIFLSDVANILSAISDEEAEDLAHWKLSLEKQLEAKERHPKNVAKA